MIKNYFKTAWRNLIKNKAHSFINIAGLTVGLTCCLLIALYIQHELSFDKFEEKGNRIARVIMQYSFDGSSESNEGNYTSVRVAAVFPKIFPEVESAIKMTEYSRVVRYVDKMFDEKNFMYAAEQGSTGDIIYKATEPYNKFSYIKDAVDDVIEGEQRHQDADYDVKLPDDAHPACRLDDPLAPPPGDVDLRRGARPPPPL